MYKIYYFKEGELNTMLVDDERYEDFVESLFDNNCSLWKIEWVD